MTTVQLVNDPRQAAMLAAPLWQRILEALAEPGSASTITRTLGLARQKVAYHVRQQPVTARRDFRILFRDR